MARTTELVTLANITFERCRSSWAMIALFLDAAEYRVCNEQDAEPRFLD